MRIAALQSVFHKTLQYQAAFSFNTPQYRGLASFSAGSVKMDSTINDIIKFWFPEPLNPKMWFMKDEALDNEIRTKYSDLVSKARTTALDEWTEKPEGVLAILILLDQFPRNIFRGSPESYSSDPKALHVASEAILKGFDKQVTTVQRLFFYLPFVHDEKLSSHVAAGFLYNDWAAQCKQGTFEEQLGKGGVDQLHKHTDVLRKFGRYPSRNEALGRTSTSAELEYLKENPNGFSA